MEGVPGGLVLEVHVHQLPTSKKEKGLPALRGTARAMPPAIQIIKDTAAAAAGEC